MVHSEEPPMIFLDGDINFDKYAAEDKQVNTIADRVASIRDLLKNKYNVELIFVIIPNKYSIYNDFIEGSFRADNFLLKLSEKLEKLSVRNIDLYSKYVKYRNEDDSELLYYSDDTHYTKRGKFILVDEIVKKVEDIKKIY